MIEWSFVENGLHFTGAEFIIDNSCHLLRNLLFGHQNFRMTFIFARLICVHWTCARKLN